MVQIRDYSPAHERIHRNMVDLLGRAGLPYQGGFVEADGNRIHYLEYGEGPPLLLVHGGGAGCAVWYRQIAALSQSFRVIAPDNPLFGLSSQPALEMPIKQFTSEYLLAFMDSIGIEKACFAGLSLGGFASISLAVDAPERVQKLVLIDAAGLGRDLPWPFRLASWPVVGRLAVRPNKFLQDRFFAAAEVVNPEGPDADVFKQYAYEVTTAEGHPEALRRNLPSFANIGGQRYVFPDSDLRSLSVPTLIIWGEKDRFFPVSHAKRAARLIPDSRLQVLPDTGHVSIWDSPDRVNELLADFFSEPVEHS
ncbi:MAG: alpha/beta fold hydrolase [Dehalococcoidia bacterium]